MRAKYIIENFTDSEDYREIINAVRNSGRECYAIDKRNYFDFDPSGYVENECIIVQGSIQMTKHIRNKLPNGCFPIAYNNWNNYLCTSYYPFYKEFLFNDNHIQLTVKELKENKFDIYGKFGREALIFVRPDSGEKSFSGQLLDLQDFDRMWTNSIMSNALDSDIIFVSTPKKINGEWRFICSKFEGKNEIISYSTYQYQGKRTVIPGAPQGAIDLCNRILEVNYIPDSVFCVDICESGDIGMFYLLELTSFSSAGLYASDKIKTVDKVSYIAEQEWMKHHQKITS